MNSEIHPDSILERQYQWDSLTTLALSRRATPNGFLEHHNSVLERQHLLVMYSRIHPNPIVESNFREILETGQQSRGNVNVSTQIQKVAAASITRSTSTCIAEKTIDWKRMSHIPSDLYTYISPLYRWIYLDN
jgi:hypothetical protein